ncbi:hypothetical protein A2U01_0000575 [Trifolium medium]|uniref:Uncharacterized protein n=1 Tax=Trifolium medium TaxID=97028 RepID=A0A392LXZ1_9FABA|nr:hypothetical protein [Trifolium medium]
MVHANQGKCDMNSSSKVNVNVGASGKVMIDYVIDWFKKIVLETNVVQDVDTSLARENKQGETVPENENGQVMTDNKEEVSDEHTDVNSPSNEKSCLNLKKFILVEWSLEVEDGLFMTGCVIDLSIIIQACSFGDDLLYGLIYFQTYINLLHLECGVCAKVIMLCLRFVDEFSSLNSATYISDGKLMVVLGAEYAKLCCSLKMYPLVW